MGPTQCKRDFVAGHDVELADRSKVRATKGDTSLQYQSIRTGRQFEPSIFLTRNPGHDRTIFETDDQFGPHSDRSCDSSYDPDQVRYAIPARHEVDDASGAGFGFEGRFKYQAVATIASRGSSTIISWRDQPTTMVGFSEQSGEAGSAVESGETQPINGSIATDKSHRFAVADRSIILNPVRHHAVNRRLILSATRRAFAMMVRDGLTAPIDGKKLASAR